MSWKLWYFDGTTHSDADEAWSAARAEGVVVVIYPDPDPAFDVAHLHGFDYFVFRPDSPWLDPAPFNVDDLVPTLLAMGHTPPDPFPDDPRAYLTSLGGLEADMVKYGVQLSREHFNRAMQAAAGDPDFPFQTVRRRFRGDWGN